MGVSIAGREVFNDTDINNPDIDGGTADNVTIGGTTPAAGTFTDLATENESTMAQRSTPTALPAAGYNKIYPKSDNKLYILHPDGTEVEVGASAQAGEGLIGTAGTAGFGVGICPLANLPTGFTPLPGYNVVGHSNYGNYQFSDGSIMVFVPKFYYRIGSASSPNYATYGANALDIKGIDTYADTAAANAAGYAVHRAFIDGGVEHVGFFFDKYMTSKNALGTGYVASSILNGLPLSSAATHNPFSGLTGGADYYYSAVDLPHRRDGSNGNINAASRFHCGSIFQRSAIAMLATAHGQAAAVNGTGTTNCAWYHATYNFPKGLNNNQAPVAGTISSADVNDTSITFASDGYSNCGRTGSGSPFAKTTHNGQTCGIADVNGLMWEISIGATAVTTSPAIEALTAANPCVVTVTGHGKSTGDYAQIGAITQSGWSTALNDKIYKITKVNDNQFSLDGVDTSARETTTDIAGLSKANPCVITWSTHGLSGANNKVRIAGITQAEWSALNGEHTITVIDVDTFSIAVDTSGFTLDYDAVTDPGTITKGVYNAAADPGTVTIGKWYVAKQATAMKTFTSGNSAATDHWGATGVAAMMEEFTPVFETSGGGAFAQRMGSGSNQVLSSSLSGSGWLLAGMGFPKDENGIDTTGTDLFGKDYYYQCIRNEMCLISSGCWDATPHAGVWGVYWAGHRANSSHYVGFRAACYPD